MSTPYDGRILLVNWVASTTPGETIEDLAKHLRSKVPNVSGVMLKTSNGVSWQGHLGHAHGPQSVTGVTRIREWVDVLAAHDLEVHVWGVPRAKSPDDIPKEADKFVTAATVPGVKSLLLDVEHGESYWQGSPAQVRTLMSRIRDGVGDATHVAMILDGRNNRSFEFWVDPWIPFVDSLHPMVYPILFNPNLPIKTHMDVPFRNLGRYSKPIVPMLQAFGEHSRRPTPAEIIQQGTLAWANGAVGLSFFRLGSDIWARDGKPHMGEPEYAAIAKIPVQHAPDGEPEPSQPKYTWQDVINAAALVAVQADASYEQWLGDAGVWSVFDNSLRTLPYAGPPIRFWPLAETHRQAILEALESYTSEQLVQRLLEALKEQEEGKVPKGEHGAIVGIHGAPGPAVPPHHTWDIWIDHMKEMGVRWYKQCDPGALDFGPHSIFAWCKRLKAEGIEPIIRYMAFPQFPDPLQDHHVEKMSRYADEDILWAEIGNEPNLDLEWQAGWRNREGHPPVMRHTNPEIVRRIAETWLHDAQRAIRAGVRPAFYAFAPTDWKNNFHPLYSSVFFTHKVVAYLAHHHRDATLEVFRNGGWIAVHAATYEQAVDFDPHRSDGTIWDMTLRGYEVVLEAFEQHFGEDLDLDEIPVMSTEGGVFTPNSTSMHGHARLKTNEEHARRVVEMFEWLEAHSPLQAMCPWCLSVGPLIGHFDKRFEFDGYIEEIEGSLRPRAVYQAMRQLRFDNERKNEQEDAAHAMIKLDVPYISQFDPTARTHLADSGPTCLAMILNAGRDLEDQVTVDALYERYLPDQDVGAFVSWRDLETIGRGEGFVVERHVYPNGDDALQALRTLIERDTPVVVMVNYAEWDEIAKNNFAGARFVTVVGFDADHVFVHDPLFRGDRRDQGAFFVWRNPRFLNGWGKLEALSQENFAALVLDKQAVRL